MYPTGKELIIAAVLVTLFLKIFCLTASMGRDVLEKTY
jgi:hypothetical protein